MSPVDVGYAPPLIPLTDFKKTVTTVATQSVQIAAQNLNRQGFVIFNNSANSCYVSWESPAVAAQCIRIIPTYASWECYGPGVYAGALYCIRNSGTGAVTVWEIIA